MDRHFDLLVFDWDGTLVDSAARIVACVHAAIGELELEPRDDASIRNIIGLGLHEAIDRLYPGRPRDFHLRFAAHYRRHFLASLPDDLPLFPGVADVLGELRGQGYRLAVATGKSRAGLDRELGRNALGRLFDATRCADETASKPDPRMLLEIIDVLAADAGRTLMIGDTAYDLEMARNAGTPSLAVAYGVHEPARLLEFGPLACLASFPELPGWLQRGSASPPPHRDADDERHT